MKKHTKIYTKYYGISLDDMASCEYCNDRILNQVHHIDARGMGGNPKKDVIQNLMGLCLDCHNDAENEVLAESKLWAIHQQNLRRADRINYENREQIFK